MSEDNSEHEIRIEPVRATSFAYQSEHRKTPKLDTVPSVDEIFFEGHSYALNQYLKSLNLPDQSKHLVNQKRDFVAKQELIKRVMADAKDAAQQAAYKIMSEHPEADGLGFRFAGKVYSQKYKGVNLSLAFIHMLDCILDKRACFTTQKAILESVKKSTGIDELNANIWKMQLKRFVKAKLIERLKSHGLQISLAKCDNMTEVRKTIDTYFAKKQAVHKIKIDLTITPKEIIVNGNTYPITTVTSGTYTYRKIRLLVNQKRTWINVDELKALFGVSA